MVNVDDVDATREGVRGWALPIFWVDVSIEASVEIG
jgi:hypothetical protein